MAQSAGAQAAEQKAKEPPQLLLWCAPGPDVDQLRALLVAAAAHIDRTVQLVGVVASGPETQSMPRARLARVMLGALGMGGVPVGQSTDPPERPGEAGGETTGADAASKADAGAVGIAASLARTGGGTAGGAATKSPSCATAAAAAAVVTASKAAVAPGDVKVAASKAGAAAAAAPAGGASTFGSGAERERGWPEWVYQVEGFDAVQETQILPAASLLRLCLRGAKARNLQLVCTAEPAVLASLLASNSELAREKLVRPRGGRTPGRACAGRESERHALATQKGRRCGRRCAYRGSGLALPCEPGPTLDLRLTCAPPRAGRPWSLHSAAPRGATTRSSRSRFPPT